MEVVICSCEKCGKKIGSFINLWIELNAQGFISPIIGSDDARGFRHGRKHYGVQGTLFEKCRLQYLLCVGCDALLGVKCVETPVNHVLARNQILFFECELVLSTNAGKKEDFVIQRVLDYDEPSTASTVTSAETPEPTAVWRQVSDLQDQVDILRSKANKSVSATDHGNEVVTLSAENADLRRLLSNRRSINNPERSSPSRELDFEILKGRVERLEADQQTGRRQNPPRASGAKDMSPYISQSSTSRKRTLSEAGLSETDLAANLPSFSPYTPLLDTSPVGRTQRGWTRRRTAGKASESSA
ncbi:hypothetical protein QBC45DRAFT_377180 [Copromyces sp. CBS 386.78]|nr:hypothetical protein QBC45DRAFT_377180 [Copromyces sp. CBS 386.78]